MPWCSRGGEADGGGEQRRERFEALAPFAPRGISEVAAIEEEDVEEDVADFDGAGGVFDGIGAGDVHALLEEWERGVALGVEGDDFAVKDGGAMSEGGGELCEFGVAEGGVEGVAGEDTESFSVVEGECADAVPFDFKGVVLRVGGDGGGEGSLHGVDPCGHGGGHGGAGAQGFCDFFLEGGELGRGDGPWCTGGAVALV